MGLKFHTHSRKARAESDRRRFPRAGSSAPPHQLYFPESETVCVPAEVLSVTVRVPETVEELLGLNVTEMVQLLPAASELDEPGQLLVCVKVLDPVMAMPLMTSGVVPVLVRIAGCVELLPEDTDPKLMLGVRVAVE